jgi:hypothetical protein
MTLFKTPYAPVRTRRLRSADDLDNRLRRDIGLPEIRQPRWVDLASLLYWRIG